VRSNETLDQGSKLVEFGIRSANPTIKVVRHLGQPALIFASRRGKRFSELDNLLLERIEVVLRVRVGLGGAPNTVHQFGPVLLEVLVEEPYVTRRVGVDLRCQDWVRSQLTETVEIQLPCKAREVLLHRRKKKEAKMIHGQTIGPDSIAFDSTLDDCLTECLKYCGRTLVENLSRSFTTKLSDESLYIS